MILNGAKRAGCYLAGVYERHHFALFAMLLALLFAALVAPSLGFSSPPAVGAIDALHLNAPLAGMPIADRRAHVAEALAAGAPPPPSSSATWRILLGFISATAALLAVHPSWFAYVTWHAPRDVSTTVSYFSVLPFANFAPASFSYLNGALGIVPQATSSANRLRRHLPWTIAALVALSCALGLPHSPTANDTVRGFSPTGNATCSSPPPLSISDGPTSSI